LDREKFKKKLKNIGITQKKFANITGYGYSTVKGWEDTPRWVSVVLDYMEILIKLSQMDESLKSLNTASLEINSKVQISDFLKKIEER